MEQGGNAIGSHTDNQRAWVRPFYKTRIRGSVSLFSGQDVFGSLPSGFGKTLCFTALPWTFDKLRGEAKKSIL